MTVTQSHPAKIAMVFAGGLGLAAYHGGVYQAFARRALPLHWVCGSSAGAVTAALLAGNRAVDRVDRLRAFWNSPSPNIPVVAWPHLSAWMGAVTTRLFGRAGQFHPRIPSLNPFEFRSLYDLKPMRERIAALTDFDRLNGGEMRLCVAATDIESGDPVIFDTDKDRIEIDHLMASCGFLPEFAPVEIGNRLLGDGGLSLNAPFDPILASELDGGLLLYVVDLYPRDGARPDSLEAALERKNDLLFGNQTLVRLQYCVQLRRLKADRQDPQHDRRRDRIVLLSYRPGAEEPGPDKSFDLSETALARRWQAGLLDMEHSQRVDSEEDVLVVRR
jgi:NTE family protein